MAKRNPAHDSVIDLLAQVLSDNHRSLTRLRHAVEILELLIKTTEFPKERLPAMIARITALSDGLPKFTPGQHVSDGQLALLGTANNICVRLSMVIDDLRARP